MADYDFTDYDGDYSTGRCGCCSRHCDQNDSAGRKKCSKRWANTLQILLLLLAVCGGVGIGSYLRFTPPFNEPELHPRYMCYLWFPAELLTRAMSLMAAPLLVSSIVSGVSSIGRAGRVAQRAIAFYLGTTILACGEGLAFVFLINPARNMTVPDINYTASTANSIDTARDIFRNLFPDNIISPIFQSASTEITWQDPDPTTTNLTAPIEVLTVGHRDHMNVLGLTLLSFFIGFAINHVGDRARSLTYLFIAVYEVVMAIINIILWFLPLGVLSMVIVTVVRLDDDAITKLVSMTWLIMTVVSGLAMHFLLVLPLLLLVLARKNPFRHLAAVARALVTALATNNSNMSLPVTMSCLVNAGYAGSVVQMLCPVGAAVNLDGSCLYDAVAVIFIATLRGIAIGPLEIIIIGLTCVGVSVAIPSATTPLVAWTILLDSLGLPRSDVLLLIPFDWLLGRLRTVVNVWGDTICVAIVCRFSKKELETLPPVVLRHLDDVSEASAVGMVMNGSYRPIETIPVRRTSFTLTVENESGDIVKVSKV